jgi:acetolactate synthase-1/2/3 large subunit
VWIDIPIDIQSAEIEPERYFICLDHDALAHRSDGLDAAVDHVIKLLQDAQRPTFLIGSGVRLSGALDLLETAAKSLKVPISTSWTAIDGIDHGHEFFAERPGVVGSRAGNFVLQNADLVIVIGSRLPIRQVSYNWENFAKDAIRVGIDIDAQELTKPLVKLDVMINADASEFLSALLKKSSGAKSINRMEWLLEIKSIKSEFPALEASHIARGHPKGCLNPYLFIRDLWSLFAEDEIIAAGDASASVIPLQIATLAGRQRLFTNAGSASMGYELPAAIGAAFANPGKRIICLAGDGSIMLNLQELETIYRYKLPIKIVVLNNEGYLSIKQSQRGFFKREKGAGLTSGLTFPDFNLIAKANKISFAKILSAQDYDLLQFALNEEGPYLIEVKIDPDQAFEPKLGSFQKENGQIDSHSLEKMSPLLADNIHRKYTKRGSNDL